MGARKRDLSEFVIVDLEATCWEKGTQPFHQKNDIIEIGICLVNLNTLKISNEKSIIVKPARSSISEFCTQLTTLTQEDVDKGIALHEAIKIVREEYSNGGERVWGSWGDYDRNMIRKQCEDYKLQYPFGLTHINIKNMFAVLRGEQKECGVGTALNKIGEEFQGTQHRGIDDAINIAKIFCYLIGEYRK